MERVVADRGTVSINPEREMYADGERVTMYAQTAFGYEFVGWSGDLIGEAANPLSVVVDRNLIVQAQFVELAWPTAVHRRITPGAANRTRVDLDIFPEFGTEVYAVQEDVPSGWEVMEVSPGGIVDTRTSRVKWGLYFDNRLRSVYYVLSPSVALPPEVVASGTTSIDGRAVTASGDEQIMPIGWNFEYDCGIRRCAHLHYCGWRSGESAPEPRPVASACMPMKKLFRLVGPPWQSMNLVNLTPAAAR